jgi:ribosomal 50S subunit-associated protein YjgA (DUF615 family)
MWRNQRQIELAALTRWRVNIVKAEAAYQDFLTLWKDADPTFPS